MATFTVSIKETRHYRVDVEADEGDQLGAIEAALAARDTWANESEGCGENSEEYIAREHRFDEKGEEYNFCSDFVIYNDLDLMKARISGELA